MRHPLNWAWPCLALAATSIAAVAVLMNPAPPVVSAAAMPAAHVSAPERPVTASIAQSAGGVARVYSRDDDDAAPVEAFRTWTDLFRAAPSEERAAMVDDGVALARARRAKMSEWIQDDPERALTEAVPLEVREVLPAAVTQLLESRVSGVGELRVLARDGGIASPGDGVLRTADIHGVRYVAHVYGRRARQLTQEGAALHGIALDGHMAVDASPVRVLERGEIALRAAARNGMARVGGDASADAPQQAFVQVGDEVWGVADADDVAVIEKLHVLAEDAPGPRVGDAAASLGSGATEQLLAAEDSWTTGEKRILVLPVDFADLPGWPISVSDGGTRISAEILRSRMEDEVAPFFAANSYGRATFAVTVAATLYRLPEPATTYTGSPLGDTQLHQHAVAAAAGDFDAAAFDVVIAVFSDLGSIPDSRMTFEALAPVGGSRIWINGHPGFAHLARSLGHSYGLYDARVSVEGREPFTSDGHGEWEADPLDVMGRGEHPALHFNEIYKAQLGWLPETAIHDVDTDGMFRVFRMDAAEPTAGQLAALRLPSRNGVSYWVGYRRPPASGPPAADGIHVRQLFDSGAAVSHLLDLTPGTPNNDVGLAVGARATDDFRGISFRTVGTGVEDGREYADVEVNLGSGTAAVWTWGEEATAAPEVENVRRIVADGSGIRVLHDDGSVSGWHVVSEVPEGLGPAADIAADRWDGYWAGAVLADGTVSLWNAEERSELLPPAGLGDVRSLAVSVYQAVALKADGTIEAWGRAGPFIAVPAGLDQVVAVEASESGTCAVRADGSVVGWGYLPAVPPELTDAVAVSPADNYIAALRRDGSVVVWGEGLSGLQRILPDVSDARGISFHNDGGLVLREDGSIAAWSRRAARTPAFTVPEGLPPAVHVVTGVGISAILAARGGPAITVQPADRSSALGGDVAFTAFAAGDGATTYQWQRLRPGHVTWTDLANSGSYAGTRTPTLRVSGIARRQSGERFRCVVTGASGASVMSEPARLLAPDALIGIATQPVGSTVAGNETVVLSVQPYGESPFTYQWFHDDATIADATGPRLTLREVTSADAGDYTVRVGNIHGTVISAPATLVVQAAPAFTQDPDDRRVAPGADVSWTVSVTGVPAPSLQWRKDGVDIPGATGVTFALTGATASDAGEYVVVATNAVGTATSRSATVTVGPTAFAGQYFGTFGESGAWAVAIDPANTGTCLIWSPGSAEVAWIGTLIVAADGTFTGEAVPTFARRGAESATGQAAPVVTNISGSIVSGELHATAGGIAGDLIASREPATGPAVEISGHFQAPFLHAAQGVLHLIVGASGRALVIAAGEGVSAGGLMLIDAAGAFSLVDPEGTEVRVQVRPGSLVLGGTIELPHGGEVIDVSGMGIQVEPVSRLVNLSTRGHVGTGDDVLVAGFVIAGTGTKPLLIRAVGPTLGSPPFGVSGAARDPRIHLVRQSDGARLDGNDNWGDAGNASELAAAMARTGAFAIPEGSGDAALLVDLPAGAYTALVETGESGAGVSLIEIYAVDDAAHRDARLVNISTRGYVGSGDAVMIPGFVAEGNAPRRLLVRGVGAMLAQPPFNVSGVQQDPVISVHRASDGERVAMNDDWDVDGAGEPILELARSVGAFDLPRGSRDAALVLTIPAHTGYTVVISGKDGASGVVLAEVYELP